MEEKRYILKSEYSHCVQMVSKLAITSKYNYSLDASCIRQDNLFAFKGNAIQNLKDAGVFDLWFEEIKPKKPSFEVFRVEGGYKLYFYRSVDSMSSITVDEGMFQDIKNYFTK